MDIRSLKTFIYVAELGGFTKAANFLGYSQSTISFQIKQLEEELEEELGGKLFERINHTVALTDQGRAVLQYAHRIDRLTQEMGEAMREEKQVAGHIRLATADSLCHSLLGEKFLNFRKEYPEVTLKIITADTKEIARLLNHNEVDFVMTLDNHIYNAEYIIVKEEKIQTHFVAASHHPLAKDGSLQISDLLKHPFLLTEQGMSYRRLMDEKLAEESLEIRPVLESGDVRELCRLVEEGVGLSFLPDYVTEDAVRAGRMVYLPVENFEIAVWKQLLYHRDKWLFPAMRAAIEYCKEC